MSFWKKLTIGMKFLFGGFESATDYALKLLNDYLSKEKVADRVAKAREYVETILGYLRKYQSFCPSIWTVHYEKLLSAVETLCGVFADNQVTKNEIEKAIADVKAAIDEWMKD